MEETIDLNKAFTILKKNLKIIFIIPILFLIISLVISFFFITPKYAASTQVLVNQKASDEQMMAQEVQSNLQLVNTYSEIIKSPRVLTEVSKKIDGKYSKNEISKMLTVTNQSESQVLDISVESKSKKDSKIIANEIASVFSKDIKDIMSVDNVSILSKADGDAAKVAPKVTTNAIISIVLGFIVAIIIVFLKEILDKRIKTEDEVNEILNLPVLGVIQKMK